MSITINLTQVKFLRVVSDYLYNLKPQGRKTILQCLSGWLNNIKAFQALLESTGLKYLFTRRISQDLLENWFGAIQSKDGCRDTHTCQQFKRT